MASLVTTNDALRVKLLNIYREELFEDAYKPAIIRGRLAATKGKAQEKLNQAEMLMKVSRLEAPEPPKQGGRKK